MENRYDVNIAGYTLTVRTERSAEHMARLCGLVNDRVREAQRTSGTTNYLHAVLLAAMKLADEVLVLEGEHEGRRRQLEERSRDLIARLDRALKGAAAQ